MHPRLLLSLLLCVALGAPALPASAAIFNPRKIKKWPEEDKVLIRALDVWMTDEEMSVFLKLKTSEERKQFLKETGYLTKWEQANEDLVETIKAGEVAPGMTKDEVYMAWDLPAKIRDEFKREAYVKVLHYEFEIDRKGREFLLRPDSQTAYKNDSLVRLVYLYNGLVHAVIEEGTESGKDVIDRIIKEEEAKEEARKAAIEAATRAGAEAAGEVDVTRDLDKADGGDDKAEADEDSDDEGGDESEKE